MKKAFCIIIVLFPLFMGAALAQRGPAVSPITEIADQNPTVPSNQAKPFNFSNSTERPIQQEVVATETGSEGSIIPMMLFLMALPVMIWIGVMQGLRVSKKRKEELPDNVAQFPTPKKKEDGDHFKKAS